LNIFLINQWGAWARVPSLIFEADQSIAWENEEKMYGYAFKSGSRDE